MFNNVFSLLGWAFLPNLVTGYLQSILYAVIIRAGEPKPAPGSKRWVTDRRRILIAVILIYLLYTIVDADYQLRAESDYYQNLGVPHDVDEKALQSRFRRLTVQFHPDKATGSDRNVIEAIYLQLKLGRDTLVDPAKRFAYDRFGPEILQWRQCKTIKDYVMQGVQRTAIYYIITGGVLVLMGTLGYDKSGKFWRYLTLAGMFVIELFIMTRPVYPGILTHGINPFLMTTGWRAPYLPFQFLALLRKISITFFIALSQLGPLLRSSALPSGDTVSPQQLDQLDALAKATEAELARLTGLELTPFLSQQGPSLSALRATLKEWLVNNTVRNDPEVNAAIAKVVARRQMQAGPQDSSQELDS